MNAHLQLMLAEMHQADLRRQAAADRLAREALRARRALRPRPAVPAWRPWRRSAWGARREASVNLAGVDPRS